MWGNALLSFNELYSVAQVTWPDLRWSSVTSCMLPYLIYIECTAAL